MLATSWEGVRKSKGTPLIQVATLETRPVRSSEYVCESPGASPQSHWAQRMLK